VELLQKLHAAARAWIQDHILKIDTQLRAVINS
jgi:hemerythrin